VDIMVSIRSNFFYTRTVPCELWFLNKAKPAEHRDKVLMLDARAVYRKVTRKIYDFSPEQLQNLLSIVWLYRGQPERFRALVASYLNRTRNEAAEVPALVANFEKASAALEKLTQPFLQTMAHDAAHVAPLDEFRAAHRQFQTHAKELLTAFQALSAADASDEAAQLKWKTKDTAPTAEKARELGKQADHDFRLAERLLEVCEKSLDAKASDDWKNKDVNRSRKDLDEARHALVEGLRMVRYFHRQAVWLTERFPEAKLVDVLGLVKLVDKAKIEDNDWSLTPGRFVGVVPKEVDEDFDFEETMRDLYLELKGLTEEAAELAKTIARNFEELIG
jgi:type I restriction enzyme M protein